MYFEIDFTNAIFIQTLCYGFGTAGFNQTGVEIFYRNNGTPGLTECLEVRMWNGSTNLLQLRTPDGSIDDTKIHYVMLTFNSTTRDFTIYLNSDAPVVGNVTNNFNAGDSAYPFFLGERDIGFVGRGWQWTRQVTCRGTILNQANFDEIRAARQKYFANTP